MQNSDDERRLDRRKKGNDLGLRLQRQQSHLAQAPVIHLLKNETMLGIWCDWSVKPTLQPHGVQEQCSLSHQPQKVAATPSGQGKLRVLCELIGVGSSGLPR